MRLDHLIVSRLTAEQKNISRAHIQRFIKSHGVLVNGKKHKKPHAPVTETDVLVFDDKALLGAYVDYKKEDVHTLDTSWIIYDADDFFVINKPPYITSEACAGDNFLVHRLDKGTSGVLVIARSLEAQNELQAQWKARTVKKFYQAIVCGHLSPAKGAIEGALYRSQTNRKKMTISKHPKAREARTEYEVLRCYLYNDMPVTHVLYMPLTGRTHQIRVHSSTIGFPIVGDPIYGHEDMNEKFGARHQMLHSQKLIIKDPKTKKERIFEAPLPDEFTKMLEQ